ncbi:MAG: hypothetical protein OXF49_01565 [Candidatus Saccharibacteria bacterium]|nr:hypothetical protein [Candidatus Saccharibacteria bacterium]
MDNLPQQSPLNQIQSFGKKEDHELMKALFLMRNLVLLFSCGLVFAISYMVSSVYDQQRSQSENQPPSIQAVLSEDMVAEERPHPQTSETEETEEAILPELIVSPTPSSPTVPSPIDDPIVTVNPQATAQPASNQAGIQIVEEPPANPLQVIVATPEEPTIQPTPISEPNVDDEYPNLPINIKTLAQRLSFTDRAKIIFYDHNPKIFTDTSHPEFKCKNLENQDNIIIHGCWISSQEIILLDTLLLETTAAHELLHAVYHKLSTQERSHINDLINKVIEQNPDKIAEILALYPHLTESSKYDELHAFIGTEFRTIPFEFENHYAKYFKNRQTVVDFYQAVIDSHQAKNQALTNLQDIYNQQQTFYYKCTFDSNSNDCQDYWPDSDTYNLFSECLQDQATLWSDCQNLQPAKLPYPPAVS